MSAENRANAALIAETPNLLAACEQAVKVLELCPESEWGWREHQVYDTLTAAIAKARP